MHVMCAFGVPLEVDSKLPISQCYTRSACTHTISFFVFKTFQKKYPWPVTDAKCVNACYAWTMCTWKCTYMTCTLYCSFLIWFHFLTSACFFKVNLKLFEIIWNKLFIIHFWIYAFLILSFAKEHHRQTFVK